MGFALKLHQRAWCLDRGITLMEWTYDPLVARNAYFNLSKLGATVAEYLPDFYGVMGDGINRFDESDRILVHWPLEDAVVVDAHLGYYFNRKVVERLRADVLLPARQQGYRRIVLVGMSLGGLGSLLCERDYPGSVDALVLLAPYLGAKDSLFDGIAAAGGPAAWARDRDPLAGGIEEQIWTFLGTKSSALPPTWLLSGTEDPYVRGHRVFATLLPAGHVTTIPGAHDWPVWRALWRDVCFHSDVFATERPAIAGIKDAK